MSRVVALLSFPCFQRNQPDLNVLTEVVSSSEFPALESACCAAYIGDLSVNGPMIHLRAPAKWRRQFCLRQLVAEFLASSHCTPFPENAGRGQKFVNGSRKSGVCPAMLSVVWLTSLFQFYFFAESPEVSLRRRIFSGRFGFILLAANSSTTLCSHSTRLLSRAGPADERRTRNSDSKSHKDIP